uniref:TIR domain-containing protein n=1 Tax=Lactuca sativa TaxID=4236 RepID=A0A9R1WWG2_LACSA|nr:hypothetical protein LSAT_V11C800408850 [Lactuca sativa]
MRPDDVLLENHISRYKVHYIEVLKLSQQINTFMASSASPTAPTFSSQPLKYHVFLSFRGEDTRNSFVGHLYSALKQKGIHTYKDNETLPRGESIGPALMKAIEESQIAVIVFSENYADSSWCLDELVHIMKCKDKRGQIILPIFYGVKPSELRKQKKKYGEAVAKHELKNKKRLKSWVQAFLENPLGWLFAPREQNHELENQTKVESWKKQLWMQVRLLDGNSMTMATCKLILCFFLFYDSNMCSLKGIYTCIL